MKVWPVLFYFSQKFGEIREVHFWVNTANNVYFGFWFAVVFFYNVKHLFNRQFPSFITLCIQA